MHNIIPTYDVKINKLTISWAHAVDAQSGIDLYTDAERVFLVFCCFVLVFVPLSCSRSKKQFLPSLSILGYFLWFDLKSCSTYEMVVLTVPSAKVLLYLLGKVYYMTDWVKVFIVTFCLNVYNSSKKTDSFVTILRRKLFHKLHVATRCILFWLAIYS